MFFSYSFELDLRLQIILRTYLKLWKSDLFVTNTTFNITLNASKMPVFKTFYSIKSHYKLNNVINQTGSLIYSLF